MPSVLAQGLGRLFAQSVTGKRHAWFPGDFPRQFFVDVVREACRARQKYAPDEDKPFALLVRPDEFDGSPNDEGVVEVTSNETAKYRGNNRLVISRAGDFSSISTLDVYVPLFNSETGLPSIQLDTFSAAILSLDDIAEAVATVMLSVHDSQGPRKTKEVDLLSNAISYVYKFTALAFSLAADKDKPWVDRWWMHLLHSSEQLSRVISTKLASLPSNNQIPGLVFASAGLPKPKNTTTWEFDDSPRKNHNAQEFCRIVEDHWCDADQAVAAVRRLAAARDDGQPHPLKALEWNRLPETRRREGHLVAASVLHGLDLDGDSCDHAVAWHSTTEDEFFGQLKRTTAGKLSFSREERKLPSVGHDGVYLLPTELVSVSTADDGTPLIVLDKLDVQVPLSLEKPLADEELASDSVTVLSDDGYVFTVNSARIQDRGLYISCRFQASIDQEGEWRDKPLKVRLELSVEAQEQSWATWFDTSASASLFVPNPVAPLFCVVQDRGSSNLRAPQFSSQREYSFQDGTFESPPNIDSTPIIDLKGTENFSVFVYDGRTENHTEPIECGGEPGKFDEDWPRFSSIRRLTPSNDGVIVSLGEMSITINAQISREAPYLPVAATADGSRPSTKPAPDGMQQDLRGCLEECFFQPIVFNQSPLADDLRQTLGQVAITVGNLASLEKDQFCVNGGLFWPNKVDEQLRTVQHAGALADYLGTEELEDFWRSFDALELDKFAERKLQSQQETQRFWPSRTSLKAIDKQRVEAYLSAFTKLIRCANESNNPSARFWASYPFSAFLVDTQEYGTLKAVLLSPLHPVRLAWLWSCEQVVADWFQEKHVHPRLLQLASGWNFPMVGSSLSSVEQRRVAAVPIDTGEEDVFLGWSALVAFDNSAGVALKIPHRAAAMPVPGASSSGLSEGGIGAALRDFLRVFPHTSTLTVDLAADTETPRMKKLDEAIIAELAHIVSTNTTGHQLPGGVRIWDSINRVGEPPSRDDVLERAKMVEVPFPFVWQRYTPDARRRNDRKVGIRFVQDAASAVAVTPEGQSDHHSLVPPVPLRRFLFRSRNPQGKLVISLRLKDSENPLLPSFSEAVRCMELVSEDEHPELYVDLLANIATDTTAEWIVTGDMHLDPVTLNSMIQNRPNDARRMIWEWRPSYLPRKTTKHLAFFERRPYISIATIPEAFRDLLGKTIAQLVDEDSVSPAAAADQVISMLGVRGVGLSSLLAMGHHHETGALGFFFSFQLCNGWYNSHEDGRVAYYVLPVDAIDDLLGEIIGDEREAPETRRADLLVLEVDTSTSPSRITIVPIEIKFFGMRGTPEAEFPAPGSGGVKDALQQLNATHNRITDLIGVQPDTNADTTPLFDSLRITGFTTLLETAFQLSIGSEHNSELELAALGDAVSGKARFCQGRGALLRFQVLDQIDKPSQVFLDITTSDCPSHAEIFINPIGCADELWNPNPGQREPNTAHAIFQKAMSWCFSRDGNSISPEDGDTDPDPHSPTDDSETHPETEHLQPAEAVRGDDTSSTAPPTEHATIQTTTDSVESLDQQPDAGDTPEHSTTNRDQPEGTSPSSGTDDNPETKNDEQPEQSVVANVAAADIHSCLELEIGTFRDTIVAKDSPVFFSPSDTRLTQLNIGIIGDLGTGKTQLTKSLIYQLSRGSASNRNHAPKILILDYKKDYIDDDFVERVGGKVVSPINIPLNFFSTDGCTSLQPRYERGRFFTDILNRIYSGLGNVQKVNLGDAVEHSYAVADARNDEPTLYDVLDSYREISKKTDSVEAILVNLTRSGLFEKDPSKLVNFRELFDRTTVVDLGALGADQDNKNMLVTIFLNFYFEYMLRLEKQPFIDTDDGRSLRFVDSFLLVDEANNILSYDFDVLEQLLLQGREFGAGVILASQYLSHFQQGKTDWKEPLHSWFLHRVPDISERDLQELGIVKDTQSLVSKTKELEPFFCVYKGMDVDGRVIRTRPFFELVE